MLLLSCIHIISTKNSWENSNVAFFKWQYFNKMSVMLHIWTIKTYYASFWWINRLHVIKPSSHQAGIWWPVFFKISNKRIEDHRDNLTDIPSPVVLLINDRCYVKISCRSVESVALLLLIVINMSVYVTYNYSYRFRQNFC